MKRVYIAILAITAIAAVIIGCSENIVVVDTWEPSSNDVQIVFNVDVDGEANGEVDVRSSSNKFDVFEFYLVKEGEQAIETKLFKKFDFETNKIYIDGVEDGVYNMHILAASGAIATDGAVINDVENLSDTWIEFTKSEFSPLVALYYTARIRFQIEGGNLTATLPDISLSHLLGRTTFKPQYVSELVEIGTKSLYVRSGNQAIASKISLGGEGSAPKALSDIEVVGDSQTIYLPPTTAGDNIEWLFSHNCETSFLDETTSQYSVEGNIESAISKSVTININHKYDEYGVRYFNSAAATNYGQGAVKFTKILTYDEEPADYVYTGSNARKVKMKTLNTTTPSTTKPSISKIALFNMQSVTQVGVYANIDGSTEKYKIVQFDALPPLVELENIDLKVGNNLFCTEDGRWHRINIKENSILTNAEVKWEGDDSFSQFINEIKVGWEIWFHNNSSYYQAFVNGEDARECLCQMFNIAWIHSQDSYWEYLHSNLLIHTANRPYLLYGDSSEQIDWDFYYTEMMAYSYWRIGVTPASHTAVAGYGSSYQFSVKEDFWLNAYGWASYKFYTILHEMGHGWIHNSTASHVSNLVSGGNHCTAIICANYFVANMSKLPFPSVASVTSLRKTHTTKN